mgnify:CR=1 FL=1
MATMLGQELATYQKQRERLLEIARGKYVLISKDQILGIFDTEADAIRQGYQQLGNVPFLAKQIVEIEPVQNFVSQLLAV